MVTFTWNDRNQSEDGQLEITLPDDYLDSEQYEMCFRFFRENAVENEEGISEIDEGDFRTLRQLLLATCELPKDYFKGYPSTRDNKDAHTKAYVHLLRLIRNSEIIGDAVIDEVEKKGTLESPPQEETSIPSTGE